MSQSGWGNAGGKVLDEESSDDEDGNSEDDDVKAEDNDPTVEAAVKVELLCAEDGVATGVKEDDAPRSKGSCILAKL